MQLLRQKHDQKSYLELLYLYDVLLFRSTRRKIAEINDLFCKTYGNWPRSEIANFQECIVCSV